MAFDADAALAALEPPAITIGGRTYVGRHVSRRQVLPFLAALERKDGTDERELVRLLRHVWPRRWWQWWRPDVVKQLQAMPPPVQEQWATDFFVSLVRMWGGTVTPPPPPPAPATSGTNSPP